MMKRLTSAIPAAAMAALGIFTAAGAQEASWRFSTDAERMIGSVDLLRPDGTPLVALRCLAAGTSVEARLAHDSAVARVAPERIVALLISPALMQDARSPGLATLRGADGVSEQVLVRLESPDNVPMAPLASDTATLAALAGGQGAMLELAGAAPISLDAPGLGEGMAQLVRHCGLPMVPAAPASELPGLAMQPAPGPASDGGDVGVTPGQVEAQDPGASAAMASGASRVNDTPAQPRAPLDIEAFDAQLLVWYLGQVTLNPRIQDDGYFGVFSNALDRIVGDRQQTPPGYPPYPTRRAQVSERQAWAREVMATAGRLNAPPPAQFMLETGVNLTGSEGPLRLSPFRGLVYDPVEIRADTALTLREFYYEVTRGVRFVFPVERPVSLPLSEAVTAQFAGVPHPAGFLRIYGTLDRYTAIPGGGSLRSATAILSIDRVELLEQVEDGRRKVPGRVLQVWDDTTGRTEPQSADLGANATPAEIRAIYGTSELDGRVLTFGVHPSQITGFRPDLAAPDTARLTRDGFVGDTAAALATRLAAIIRAAPERPLSTPVAVAVAQTLLTPAERDTLFPPLTFNRNTPQIERDAALRAGDDILKAAVLRVALPSPLAMAEMATTQAQPYNAQFGVLQINASRAERLWIARFDSMFEFSEALPMTEAQAIELLRYQTGRGHPMQMVQRLDWMLVTPEAPPGRTGPIEEREIDLIVLRAVPERLRIYADFEMTAVMVDRTYDTAPSGDDVPRELFLTTWESLVGGMAALFPEAADVPVVGDRVSTPPAINALSEPLRTQAIAEEDARVRALARDEYHLLWQFTAGEYDEARGGFRVGDREPRLSIPHDQDLSMDPQRQRPSFGHPAVAMGEAVAFDLLAVPPEHRDTVEAFRGNWNAMQVVLRGRLVPALAPDHDDPWPARFVPEEVLFGPPSQRTGIESVALRLPWPAPDQAAPASAAAEVVPPETLILDAEAVDLLVLRHAPELFDDRAFERMLIERLARERAASQVRPDSADIRSNLPWGQFFTDPAAGLTPEARTGLLPAFRAWSEARAAALPEALVLVGAGESSQARPVHDCETAFRMWEPVGHPGEALVNEVLGSGTWEEYIATAVRRRNYDTALIEFPVLRFLPGGITRSVQGFRQSCASAATLIARDSAGPTAFVTGFDMSSAPVADLILIGDEALETRGGGLATFFHLSDVRLAVRPVGPPGTPVVATVVMGAATERVVALDPPALATLPPTERVVWSQATRQAERGIAPDARDIVGITLGIDRRTFEDLARAHLGAPLAGTVSPREDSRHLGETRGFVDPETGETLVAVFLAAAPDGPAIAIGRRLFLPTGTDPGAVMAAIVEKYGPPGREEADLMQGPEPRYTMGFPEFHLDTNQTCGQRTERESNRGTESYDADLPPGFVERFGRGMIAGVGAIDDRALGTLLDPPSGQTPKVPCGPSVIAAIQGYATSDTRLQQLIVWLVDMGAAAEAARAAQEAAPEAPRIRL